MSSKQRALLILIPCALIVVVLGALLFLSGRVTPNPAGTIGNTAGNLNNDGLFCEYNQTVYFANSSAGGSLYAMNADESNIRSINSLKVRNLLAGGDYLYYFQTGSAESSHELGWLPGMKTFDRCTLDGRNVISLTTDTIVTGQLVDNYLYLLSSTAEGPSFYKLKIDNSDKTELAQLSINPACAGNGTLYYNGVEDDHYLYALNTANDVVSEVWRGNIWFPTLEGDYIYYLDVAGNYRLCRYCLSLNIVEILTEDRVDCFNVGGGYIYYQKNGSDARLICMQTDGSNPQTVAIGNYTRINMTSRYVYFQAFGDESTTYHSPLGSTFYEVFAPASL